MGRIATSEKSFLSMDWLERTMLWMRPMPTSLATAESQEPMLVVENPMPGSWSFVKKDDRTSLKSPLVLVKRTRG